MALTNAERQGRSRAKRDALARGNAEVVERALLEEAARCEQLSAEQRVALADKIMDLANGHLWRSHELARIAHKVRTGSDH